MIINHFPPRETWPAMVERPSQNQALLEGTVKPVIEAIRLNGDRALRQFTLQFDGADLKTCEVSARDINASLNAIEPSLLDAITQAAGNITAFHKTQLRTEDIVETMPGVRCWRRSVAIEKVGLYIPGGTAPLFSTVLMLAIPAMIAGCREIIVCTPPDRQGNIHPAVLAAAAFLGIKKIYRAGGAQAIAAMALGTETIPQVFKIFGPGNQYVTAAKQLLQKEGVAIDMPAGPSEVAIYADASATPAFIAADLLSQAEHGADSQVVLVTDHEPLIAAVQTELATRLPALNRRDVAGQALQHSQIILVRDSREAMDWLNRYAPEHLILACADAEKLAGQVVNAGSVFIGHYSPESAGDYASGTNHTLPTNGYACAYSGVSVDSFVKKITFQQLSEEGLRNIGSVVETMAHAEGLQAHAEAIAVRLKKIDADK